MVFDNTILIEDDSGNGIGITFEEARELYKRLAAMFEPEDCVVDKLARPIYPDRVRWDGSPLITTCYSRLNGSVEISYSDGTKVDVSNG